MTSATEQKTLRVSVSHGGKVDVRHLHRPETVTVGSDRANTFVVSGPEVPKLLPVIEFNGASSSLLISENMSGQVSVGGVKVSLDAIVSQGRAKKRDDVYVLPLAAQTVGSVSVGPLQVSFGFVEHQPVNEPFPKELRGSILSNFDSFFLTILFISLLIHGGGAAWILLTDLPPEAEQNLEQLPDRFAKLIMPSPLEPQKLQPMEKVKVDSAKETEDKAEDKKPEEEVKEAAADSAQRPSKPTQDIQKSIAGKGLLKSLGAATGAGKGAFQDVLGNSSGTADVAAALADASGVGVATAETLGNQGPKGSNAGSVESIGKLGTSGGGNVNLGNKGDIAVSGRVRDAAPEVESSAVDTTALTRYVRSRMTAIQTCYERELKRNPTLKGKVVVRFAITPNGRSSEIEIEENTLSSDAVASCIRNVIRTWVFPFKPDDEVLVAYPFLFAPAS